MLNSKFSILNWLQDIIRNSKFEDTHPSGMVCGTYGKELSVPGTVKIESGYEFATSAAAPGTGPRVRARVSGGSSIQRPFSRVEDGVSLQPHSSKYTGDGPTVTR